MRISETTLFNFLYSFTIFSIFQSKVKTQLKEREILRRAHCFHRQQYKRIHRKKSSLDTFFNKLADPENPRSELLGTPRFLSSTFYSLLIMRLAHTHRYIAESSKFCKFYFLNKYYNSFPFFISLLK